MKIHFQKYQIRTQQGQIFDEVRKKWLVATPEEQVRQLWVHYLLHTLKVPIQQLALEKLVSQNKKEFRFDLLYFKSTKPFVLFEFKRPEIPLDPNALLQASIYFEILDCTFLILSNGLNHLGWQKTDTTFEPILSIEDINF
ncbi:MAG: type I restriction enzyme HsdR N-terminal domain-containing protein [Chitinophagales bacterium]|jgi:hypothetical protein|nr:type I restriction enzyme HsdR N-terminal domain-containing protein [Chitinophagales bacterium]